MTDIDSHRDLARKVLSQSMPASRRGLMCGLAGLGAVGALAACGEAESGDSGASSEPSAGGDEETGGDTDTGTGALTSTEEVPVGGGIVVNEIVVVQPTADEFLAFSAVCPHQGTIVGAPDADGVITCPNHGSQFDLDGELVTGPAETGLTEVDITVEENQITLA